MNQQDMQDAEYEENAPVPPEATPAPEPKALVPFQAGAEVSAFVPTDDVQLKRVARLFYASGMKNFPNEAGVAVAIMHGAELGMTPMAAVQSIAVINGRPTLWGDALLALIFKSGEIEDIEEFFEGEEYVDSFKAVCVIHRKGRKRPTRVEFSVADAKRARLWDERETIDKKNFKTGQVYAKDVPNDSPWYRFPKRMLQMRARSWAVRDCCADLLRGLGVREEHEDIDRNVIDVEATVVSEAPAIASAPPTSAPPPKRTKKAEPRSAATHDGPLTDTHVAEAKAAIAEASTQPVPLIMPAHLVDKAREEYPGTEVVAQQPIPTEKPAEAAKSPAGPAARPPPPPPRSPAPSGPAAPPPPKAPEQPFDSLAFINHIEAELKKLTADTPDVAELFGHIETAATIKMESGELFPPDAGALSDLLEKHREELGL